jgi:hypothetical protein
MIPPVPPSVLDTHPGFAKLHKHLVESKLDIDGSTCRTTEQCTKTREQLEASRTEGAKDEMLLSHLRSLYGPGSQLPSELQDLLSIAVQYMCLGQSLSDEETELLQPDIQLFREKFPDIADALSQTLSAQHTELTTAASLACRDHQYSRHNPSADDEDLNAILQTQFNNLTALRTQTLPSSLTSATNALTTLLTTQSTELQRRIRSLEQNKYGSESRHLQARVQFLAAVAQGMEGKVMTEFLEQKRDLYGVEIVRRLEGRVREMEGEERELREKRRVLEGVVGEFEDADGGKGSAGVLLRLGRRYGEIEEEIRAVKGDVERLQRGDRRVK